jgi:hypothetical protein
VALKLADGEHTLEFSAKHIGGRTSFRLTCRPGEVTYLVISATSNEGFWNPTLSDWRIDRNDMIPERFVRRPMILLDEGQWYVDTSLNE